MSPEHQSVPTISVVLPVHNGEAYLREALESILAQTFRDFELIGIDDGSTDGTLAILEEYAKRDDRVRIVSREQRGLVATLNEGIDLARGAWIARMDADDIAMPNRFAIQLAQLKRSQADFCGGAVRCFGDWVAVWHYPVNHEACEVHMLFDVPFAHPAVMGRRDAFRSLRYSEDFLHCEDYDLWQRAWAAGYRFTNAPEVVLRYRVHGRQVSSRHQGWQRQSANRVRFRHWQALLPTIDGKEIERIVDVLEHGRGKTDWLMPALRQLLARYSGEARMTLLSDSFRVFCKIAGHDQKAALNWIALTRHVTAYRKRVGEALALQLMSLFRMQPDGTLYETLRRLYAASLVIRASLSPRPTE